VNIKIPLLCVAQHRRFTALMAENDVGFIALLVVKVDGIEKTLTSKSDGVEQLIERRRLWRQHQPPVSLAAVMEVEAKVLFEYLPVGLKQRAQQIFTIARDLALDAEQVIPFSAVTGEGRNDLAEAVESLLAQPSWRSVGAPEGASEAAPEGAAE
jgi:hypothetical protein